MKFRDIKNFEKFEKGDFFEFLIVLVSVGVTAFVLAINSSDDGAFIGFYSFCGGTFFICFFIYAYPLVKEHFSTTGKYRPRPGDVLLIGIDGSRPIAKSRGLEDIIRRNKI